MSIIVKDQGGGDFQIPKAGLHNAVCTAVFDLGMQQGYQGQMQHKVGICWELDERITVVREWLSKSLLDSKRLDNQELFVFLGSFFTSGKAMDPESTSMFTTQDNKKEDV